MFLGIGDGSWYWHVIVAVVLALFAWVLLGGLRPS